MKRNLPKLLAAAILSFCVYTNVYSQRYLSDLDTSLFIKDTLRPFLKRFDNIHFSGYIQPQFQVAESKGAHSYDGGDFSTYSSSRIMLRRARIKLDYFIATEDRYPRALFTFQMDATERGVFVRDMFMRLYETKGHNFSFTAGLFARPFGFEVNLGSNYRESPERGRMSQTLMPTERDLGMMVTYEPLKRLAKNRWVKIDAGFFNGQGLSGTTDFDSHKDFISRVTIKPIKTGNLEVSGGLSLLQGGWRQQSKYIFINGENNSGEKMFVVDSSESNVGKILPRQYYGADLQLKLKHAWGATEIRGEYWFGKQPGTETSTTNPGILPVTPGYIRNFSGAFFYFLQNIVNDKNQLLLKYDWYDPNKKVGKNDIGKAGTNLTVADIKYATFGIGCLRYISDNIKLLLYYSLVKNETTGLAGYSSDLKDNIFTFRLQFKF